MIQWSTTTVVDPNLPPTHFEFPHEKELRVVCPHCAVATNAPIRGFVLTKQNRYHRLPDSMVVCNYMLECTHCGGAMLLMWTHNLEEQKLLGGDGPLTAGTLLFPHASAPIIEDATALPEAVANDLSQAELCLNSGGVRGAAMLFRSACQYVCLDAHCDENKPLYDQINELVTKQKILPDMAIMAHNVRIIGNAIAHPNPNALQVITREDVLEAREFVRQLVQTIYVNPKRAEAVRASLKSRNVKGA